LSSEPIEPVEPVEPLGTGEPGAMSDGIAAMSDGIAVMFDGIAGHYDLLNRMMSLGFDRGWRDQLVAALAPEPGCEHLDLATGTAEVAIAIARRCPACRVTGVDPSGGMLAVGRRKVAAVGLAAHIELRTGDAQALDFEDDRFAAACMAFGIRNVPDRARALAELARVVRPGGRVVILELSEPRRGLLAPMARFYIHSLLPRLATVMTGAAAYRYLPESIAVFPPPEEFAKMMRTAGLERVGVASLTLGVCHLFTGFVPAA